MKALVVVDDPKKFELEIEGGDVVSARTYLTDQELGKRSGIKVLNLCRSLKYQSAGYYVSLLAEARGHRPLPSVSVIQDTRYQGLARILAGDFDELLQHSLARIKTSPFELSIYFGHNLAAQHERLARAVFNAFPAPMLRAKFVKEGEAWRLTNVRVLGLGDVPITHHGFLVAQAERFLRRQPRKSTKNPPARFDLAILHDPNDPMPPSDPEALEKFVRAGRALGIECELVQKDAYGRLGEFDALFLRETTSVAHHTFRFARRAEALGMVVIDDPTSILRCTNKVFLAETMARSRIATPKTRILSRDDAVAGLRELGFPCVVKLPDGAFSAGVSRIDSEEDLEQRLDELFKTTELLIAQEYLPTDFDWRVGLIGGEPLYASRYGMAPGHWQILERRDGETHTGTATTVAVEDAPKDVIALAVKAAARMGDGLYGVDLKVANGKAVVIEVNDNPNIDAGVEDAVLGDRLYERIMRHFLVRLEALVR
jgi:glutathione synthase/RimK-type ligase-like ATP-grasp enzyme